MFFHFEKNIITESNNHNRYQKFQIFIIMYFPMKIIKLTIE